jgi:hypothetical protein
MRFNIAVAVACILTCFAAAYAQQPPPLPSTMQVVQLTDLSQARKDLASAFVNMSFYKRGEMREDVMFAGGDYVRDRCSVSAVTDLYVSTNKAQPEKYVLPLPALSQARANLAGELLHCLISTGLPEARSYLSRYRHWSLLAGKSVNWLSSARLLCVCGRLDVQDGL